MLDTIPAAKDKSVKNIKLLLNGYRVYNDVIDKEKNTIYVKNRSIDYVIIFRSKINLKSIEGREETDYSFLI